MQMTACRWSTSLSSRGGDAGASVSIGSSTGSVHSILAWALISSLSCFSDMRGRRDGGDFPPAAPAASTSEGSPGFWIFLGSCPKTGVLLLCSFWENYRNNKQIYAYSNQEKQRFPYLSTDGNISSEIIIVQMNKELVSYSTVCTPHILYCTV